MTNFRRPILVKSLAFLLCTLPSFAFGAPRVPTGRTRTKTRPTLRERIGSEYRVSRLKDGSIRFKHSGFTADVRMDGTVRMRDHKAGWSWRVFGLFFDITEAVMRSKGQDPYAADKIRFLKATLGWRLALRKRWKQKLRSAYLNSLPGKLRRIWNRATWSAAYRRKLLFMLWDECREADGTKEGRLGQFARETIIRFIRRHLPAGTPSAYTAGELAAYAGKRESRQAFRPYFTARPAAGRRLRPRARPRAQPRVRPRPRPRLRPVPSDTLSRKRPTTPSTR